MDRIPEGISHGDPHVCPVCVDESGMYSEPAPCRTVTAIQRVLEEKQ